jgi:hypothetical protein
MTTMNWQMSTAKKKRKTDNSEKSSRRWREGIKNLRLEAKRPPS